MKLVGCGVASAPRHCVVRPSGQGPAARLDQLRVRLHTPLSCPYSCQGAREAREARAQRVPTQPVEGAKAADSVS
jgi:hypothetical protein